MAYLVLVRHGQSEWNALGLWTGQQDIPLTDQGRQEAQKAASYIKDIKFYKAYISKLLRAKQTLVEIKKVLNDPGLEIVESSALNERDYGDFTGKNKWEIRSTVGEAEFQQIRRSWDHPIPNGETLKDVFNRAVPYFTNNILVDLKGGKHIIISAHGNSLRAIMKYLDKIDDDKISGLEIGTGEVVVYEISESGQVTNKTVRTAGGKA